MSLPNAPRALASRELATLLLATALLALPALAAAQVPNPGSEGKLQLQWLKTYPEALERAETEKKPLFIDVTTDWCGWSKKMDRETFADLAVQKQLRSFGLLRLNPEASEKNEKVAESFGVDGYPTLIIANARGEQIGQCSGYSDPKQLLEFIQRFLPMFKGNPLGYKAFQLEAGDPLLKAIQKIPPPESRPASQGAFVVLDQADIQLQANGTAKLVARTATFIADPEKADLPDANRFYVSSRQKLKLKSVRILDTHGSGREVDLKLAKDEHAYSNQNIYWDARRVSVELPMLKEGQILDVVEEHELQPVLPGEFYFRWNTAPKILLTSDLSITFPASLKLQKRPVRCATEVTERKNADGTMTWQLKTSNAKPYEPALFSPPIFEIWEGYDFFTPTTKDDVATWFAGLCRGRDTLPDAARMKVAALKKGNPSQPALLQAIMDWVTKDIRYVSVAFGASSHQPHTVSDTLANLYGDCKDQSLLVQALCREAGIPAALVLVDAMGEGFDESCPAIERFNHCIVEATVEGKPCYVDPAAGRAKVGRLARSFAGTRALKIDGSAGRTVSLPPYQPLLDQESSHTLVSLNSNGSANVFETAQYAGEKAQQMREQMKRMPPEKLRKYLETAYKKSGRKLLSLSMTGTNDTSDQFQSSIAYTIPRFGSMTAGGLAIRLAAPSSDEWIGALNLPRSQPFRFRTTDDARASFIVELPPGWAVKGHPEDVQIDTPFMLASRRFELNANRVTATETVRLRDARLAASEAGKVYSAFRKLHDHREYAYVVEASSASAALAEPSPKVETSPRTGPGPQCAPVSNAPGPAAAAALAGRSSNNGLRLGGISGAPGHRLAIINGKTLGPGESAVITLEGRETVIECISIGDQSASVSIQGISGTTSLEMR